MPNAITFITTNANKLLELSTLLTNATLTPLALDLPELQGTSLEIVHAKLISAATAQPGLAVCVEDTSLSFDALSANGVELPGPYIKQFLQSLGPARLSSLLSPYESKCATATTLIAYTNGTYSPLLVSACNPTGVHFEVFIGETRGRVVEPRGCGGFGWDGVFEPEGCDKTYGEMSKAEKGEVSHRGKAAVQFNAYLALL